MIIKTQFLAYEPKLVDESHLNHRVLCFYQVECSNFFLLHEPLRSCFTLIHRGTHFPRKAG